MWGRRILRGSEEGFMEHEGKWNSFLSLCLSLPWVFLVFTILHLIWHVVVFLSLNVEKAILKIQY